MDMFYDSSIRLFRLLCIKRERERGALAAWGLGRKVILPPDRLSVCLSVELFPYIHRISSCRLAILFGLFSSLLPPLGLSLSQCTHKYSMWLIKIKFLFYVFLLVVVVVVIICPLLLYYSRCSCTQLDHLRLVEDERYRSGRPVTGSSSAPLLPVCGQRETFLLLSPFSLRRR